MPPLPPPETFLKAGEVLGLCGGVAKKGPSILSPFRNRLLVLTGRRLLYFAPHGGPPGVVWLTRDSVCGATHGGLRFELLAQPWRGGVRRYYFEPLLFLPNYCASESDVSSPPQPGAQAWVDNITAAIAKLRTPVPLLSSSAESSSLPGSELLRRLWPAPAVLLRSAHPTARQAGRQELCPPLPEPSSFLYAGEALVLSGPVTKQGPSKLSLFKPRLLVLTTRRLLYFSANPSDKRGVMVLTPDAVAGVTHQGKRFELSAYPLGEQKALRRYYFEVGLGAEPAAQKWVEAVAKAVKELWSPADDADSSGASNAQQRSAAAPLPGSPGAVAPQMATSRRGSDDPCSAGGDERDELPFEEQLQAFISDLERFLGTAKPGQDMLEADAHAMGVVCEAVSARFNCHDDDDDDGTPIAKGASVISGAQAAFAGLVKFANLLAKARFKWDADHGRGLAEVYSGVSHGADDDTDEEDDEDPLIERLAHYISIGVTFEQVGVVRCTPPARPFV